MSLSKTKYKNVESDIEFLERRIDKLEEELEALKNFILPGGSPSSAWLHYCRCICRRAERAVVAAFYFYAGGHDFDSPGTPSILLVTYLNRLSDFLFVYARYEAKSSGGDVIWKPS